MGRVNKSFRIKLDEAVSRIRSELLSLMIDEKRRKASEKIIKVWYDEANALANFNQPYIYGTVMLLSIIDLQRQINLLEEEVRKLREKVERITDRSTNYKQ